MNKQILVMTALCILTACGKSDDKSEKIFSKLFSSPSATEIFHLNSECGELGKKYFIEQVGELFQRGTPYKKDSSFFDPTSGGGSASFDTLDGNYTSHSVTSYYNPETNHCYSYSKDWYSQSPSDKSQPETSSYLHDNQTAEDLASTSDIGFKGNEKRKGMVSAPHKISGINDNGWTDANAYIDKMMGR